MFRVTQTQYTIIAIILTTIAAVTIVRAHHIKTKCSALITENSANRHNPDKHTFNTLTPTSLPCYLGLVDTSAWIEYLEPGSIITFRHPAHWLPGQPVYKTSTSTYPIVEEISLSILDNSFRNLSFGGIGSPYDISIDRLDDTQRITYLADMGVYDIKELRTTGASKLGVVIIIAEHHNAKTFLLFDRDGLPERDYCFLIPDDSTVLAYRVDLASHYYDSATTEDIITFLGICKTIEFTGR